MSDITKALAFVRRQIEISDGLGIRTSADWRRVEVLLMKLERLEAGPINAAPDRAPEGTHSELQTWLASGRGSDQGAGSCLSEAGRGCNTDEIMRMLSRLQLQVTQIAARFSSAAEDRRLDF